MRQVFCQRVAFGADGLTHWVMRNIRVFMVVMMIGTVAMTAIASDTLKVKFRSRALLDATASGYGKDEVQGYYRLEDFRVGFKANYGKFELKADIGLGGGKVAVKDLLLNYHFNNSVISVGNGYEPFSMDMLISTADLRLHQSAASVLAFTNSRKLGVTYHYHDDNWYLATGVYTNNDINKLGDEKKKFSRVHVTCRMANARPATQTLTACGRSLLFSYERRKQGKSRGNREQRRGDIHVSFPAA